MESDTNTDPKSAAGESLSPSIATGAEDDGAAFEMKFLVSAEKSARILEAVRTVLMPDPHGSGADPGRYTVTTLYFDTPDLAVYHREESSGGAKHRLRRYGDERGLWVERKTRRGDRVTKRRTPTGAIDDSAAPDIVGRALAGGGGPADWFAADLRRFDLRPACVLRYERRALFGRDPGGVFRLTFDEAIRGGRFLDGAIEPDGDAVGVLDGQVIVEMKFRNVLPSPFKALLAGFGLAPTSVSKYRRVMQAAGLAH